jgi:hypothetical protein
VAKDLLTGMSFFRCLLMQRYSGVRDRILNQFMPCSNRFSSFDPGEPLKVFWKRWARFATHTLVWYLHLQAAGNPKVNAVQYLEIQKDHKNLLVKQKLEVESDSHKAGCN